ncbi:hypothetical protein CHS0354_031659 [Potamilus streckersoni]|uniref:Uncharacterized protein n=1 Tax=Potamilus streckersoni TaxID=2493646 RepID=A0AAE0TEU3_9BIVA|nr:hypothetical protein CHS0354_031659 [Potamilus streckersoni]
MVLKDSTIGRNRIKLDAVSKSLLVSEIENVVSKEELSQDQVQKLRSRSFWGSFRHFLRTDKKEKALWSLNDI